jgi:light-regulated signal transduction histidine kinase (bacteriophytochrome)
MSSVSVDVTARRITRLESQLAAMEQLIDVTERTVAEQAEHLEIALKQLDERNRELKRSNEELETFAYVASHDLQEPLRMVASYTQLLARRYSDKLDDDAREFIHFAVDGASRMQALIEALLEYSRVGTRTRPFEIVNMDNLLDGVLGDLRLRLTEKAATLTRDPLPVVHGDPAQITQLLLNLLSNALKFSPAPSLVHISSHRRNDDTCVIAVRDNGIGIDPRFADRIFQIFQRLHTRDEYPGTGIGLAVCRRIVERHGGTIWFEPTPGGGSTFCFTLPCKSKGLA